MSHSDGFLGNLIYFFILCREKDQWTFSLSGSLVLGVNAPLEVAYTYACMYEGTLRVGLHYAKANVNGIFNL